MSNTPILLTDGTKCWSGPNCKLHGDKHAPVVDFNAKLDALNNPTPEFLTISNPSFSFPTRKLTSAMHKIELANRKLERAGIEERFEYEVSTEIRYRNGVGVEYSTMTLNTPSISYDGWDFKAVHEFAASGGVISHYAKEYEPPSEDITNRCEHCGSNRHREKVYVVTNREGVTKQVGSSCIKAFLGVKPSGMWALDSDLGLSDYEPNEMEDEILFSDRTAHVFESEDAIAAALVASNNGENFLSRSAADGGQTPTADQIMTNFKDWSAKISTEQRELAREIIAYANSLENQNDNSYVANLKSALGEGERSYVRYKDIPLAVSAIASWRAAKSKAIEEVTQAKLKEAQPKSFIAAPGEKLNGIKATVTRKRTFPGSFGYNPKDTDLLILQAEDGHIIKWSTTNSKGLEEGDEVYVDNATVKANQVYEETYQTVIKTPKITKV